MDFTQYFLYVPGIIIFLVGSGMARNWLAERRGGNIVEASVVSCNHIVKTDHKGNETYNYYTVMVEYPETRTGKTVKKTIKSADEYFVGQPVKMMKQNGSDPVLYTGGSSSVFGPWSTMIGGALLILLAMFSNQDKEVPAMVCLAAFLIGAGAVMIYSWLNESKLHLIDVDAVITGTFSRQISKETKILKGNKFTYYPIVTYEVEGVSFKRRLQENSSSEKAYKESDHITLKYDTEKKCIVEKTGGKTRLIWGIVLLIIGLLAAVSIIGGISMGA